MIEPLQIVYRSSALVVVNKPSGLLTQAPPGIPSAELELRRLLGGSGAYVGCLHRLDRPVSGLLAFGTCRRSVRKLARQFERRTVSKTYWALVEGRPAETAGRWVDYMRKIPDEPRSEMVDPSHPDAQEAILDWTLLESRGGLSLLEIRLETGRTHQIRVQCAARCGPVLGDAQYGSPSQFGPACPDERERPIALHARALEIDDPATALRVALTQNPPPVWRDAAGDWALAPTPDGAGGNGPTR